VAENRRNFVFFRRSREVDPLGQQFSLVFSYDLRPKLALTYSVKPTREQPFDTYLDGIKDGANSVFSDSLQGRLSWGLVSLDQRAKSGWDPHIISK